MTSGTSGDSREMWRLPEQPIGLTVMCMWAIHVASKSTVVIAVEKAGRHDLQDRRPSHQFTSKEGIDIRNSLHMYQMSMS